MPTCAEVIARTLREAGIERIYGLPGGEIVELIEACRREGIAFLLTRHENTAALMAGVAGQLSGRPGVCLATVGPGASNMVNGVANAYLDRSPMLAISAQLATDVAPVLPHQRLDLEDLYRPITKWSTTLTGSHTAAVVRRALEIAATGRQGPVYLSLPSDVARRPEGTGEPPTLPQVHGPEARGDLDQAARSLAEARRPICILGIGADPIRWRPAILRFVEARQMPVLVSAKAKGIVPEDHPLFLATGTGMAGDKLVTGCLKSSDLLVGIGFDPVEAIRPFYRDLRFLAIGQASIADRSFAPQIEILGDVPRILDALLQAPPQRHAWTASEIQDFRARLAAALTPAADRTARGLSPYHVIARLRRKLPREAILAVDTGAHKLLAGQAWPAYEPLTYLVSHGLSTMGYFLPAAMAAKLEHPRRPVFALTGDGGFAMILAELETAARLNLPIVSIVLTDESLFLIEMGQERRNYPSTGTTFQAIDFAGIAPGFGAVGFKVSSWEEFDAAVEKGLAADRPVVIQVGIDPAEYRHQL